MSRTYKDQPTNVQIKRELKHQPRSNRRYEAEAVHDHTMLNQPYYTATRNEEEIAEAYPNVTEEQIAHTRAQGKVLATEANAKLVKDIAEENSINAFFLKLVSSPLANWDNGNLFYVVASTYQAENLSGETVIVPGFVKDGVDYGPDFTGHKRAHMSDILLHSVLKVSTNSMKLIKMAGRYPKTCQLENTHELKYVKQNDWWNSPCYYSGSSYRSRDIQHRSRHERSLPYLLKEISHAPENADDLL